MFVENDRKGLLEICQAQIVDGMCFLTIHQEQVGKVRSTVPGTVPGTSTQYCTRYYQQQQYSIEVYFSNDKQYKPRVCCRHVYGLSLLLVVVVHMLFGSVYTYFQHAFILSSLMGTCMPNIIGLFIGKAGRTKQQACSCRVGRFGRLFPQPSNRTTKATFFFLPISCFGLPFTVSHYLW